MLNFFSCTNRPNIVDTGLEGKPIPSFNLRLMDSTTTLNTTEIPSKDPIVFIYFSPICPYCRLQTEEMIANIQTLSKIKLVMISNFSFNSIKQFYNNYKLSNYSNITVGQDYEKYFSSHFNAEGVPFTAIYDKNGILQKALLGKIKPEIIKNIVFQ